MRHLELIKLQLSQNFHITFIKFLQKLSSYDSKYFVLFSEETAIQSKQLDILFLICSNNNDDLAVYDSYSYSMSTIHPFHGVFHW